MIELQPFTKSDFQRLINWIDSPELLLQWGGPTFFYPLDESQLEQYLGESEGIKPKKMIFKAIDNETRNVVGHIEIDNIDRKSNSARICRVLVGSPNLRNRGIGSLIMKAILKICFRQLKLHRVELQVWSVNKSAIACYEKIGFVKEGLLRDARRMGNRYYNVYQMSMLEEEWKAQNL
ncbi:MAG TPA: N-acetyltransferase [Thermoplasmatales archaeon]|nr:N-acetyltransferase [Thermoplasmatales archaeon]